MTVSLKFGYMTYEEKKEKITNLIEDSVIYFHDEEYKQNIFKATFPDNIGLAFNKYLEAFDKNKKHLFEYKGDIENPFEFFVYGDPGDSYLFDLKTALEEHLDLSGTYCNTNNKKNPE